MLVLLRNCPPATPVDAANLYARLYELLLMALLIIAMRHVWKLYVTRYRYAR